MGTEVLATKTPPVPVTRTVRVTIENLTSGDISDVLLLHMWKKGEISEALRTPKVAKGTKAGVGEAHGGRGGQDDWMMLFTHENQVFAMKPTRIPISGYDDEHAHPETEIRFIIEVRHEVTILRTLGDAHATWDRADVVFYTGDPNP